MRFVRINLVALCGVLGLFTSSLAQEVAGPKLLLAFSSVRERHAPPYPRVFFYEHDGVGQGKIVGLVESITKGDQKTRSDMHPTLSANGRYCAFSAQMGPVHGASIEVWDRQEKKLLTLPGLNTSTEVHHMSPSFTASGQLLAFMVWARPGASSRWGVFAYDLKDKKMVDLPKINSETSDQRLPALSGDGRWLAYASNARGGVGLNDVYLYDMAEKKILTLPEMNSKSLDMQPALSGDGRLVAFSSDRPGGLGGRDIYLYDRLDKKFLPLPGLNSPDHEQSPCLSADGRFLTFVSERPGGAGERDVYLYDREKQKLLPLPGLNSKDDDYDPCVVMVNSFK